MPIILTMPKLSPTMEEGTITKWYKKEGEFVSEGELLLEIATDKATIEHNILDGGWLRKILVPEGGVAHVNQPISILTEDEKENIEKFLATLSSPSIPAPQEEQKVEAKTVEPTTPSLSTLKQPAFVPEPPLKTRVQKVPSSDRLRASPLAKRLAKERGLNLSTVQGTGPGGRITSKDLDRAQPNTLVTFGRGSEPTETSGSYDEIPLTPMRRAIARRLQESKSFIPHFYLRQTIDAEPLFKMRKELLSLSLQVTFNDLIIRASALALRKHPEINSGFNSVHQTIVRFKTVDISIAVTIEGGLITPIVRDADFKNVGQISKEVHELIERAKKNKLKEEEYKGGSFCLSNLGMYGIDEFTAVINPPQSAILAIGGIVDSPVVRSNQVVVGKKLTLTLSADHRVVDGVLAALFMKTVQGLLENPAALLLT